MGALRGPREDTVRACAAWKSTRLTPVWLGPTPRWGVVLANAYKPNSLTLQRLIGEKSRAILFEGMRTAAHVRLAERRW